MTVAYIAYSFLSNYSNNNDVTNALDSFEWILIPLVNPDGYNYSWTTDRLWRKNRRVNQGSTCVGVDTNRNWNYKWNGGGSSANPCSETFHGAFAFSEPEDALLGNYINAQSNVVAYIDFHAAAYLMLSPWSWTTAYPPDSSAQLALAQEFVTAVYKVHGKAYVFGTSAEILYISSGGAKDWTYAIDNIIYSYTIELREGPTNVFILPPEQIIPQGQEMVGGVFAMVNYIINNSK